MRECAGRAAAIAVVLLLGVALRPAWSADDKALTIWYSQPATDWEREALPIGNGAMGAMIFGDVATERLQFNEKTLWSGGPGTKDGYDHGIPAQSIARDVAAVAKQLDETGELQPKEVARRLGREPRGYGDYLTFGDVFLQFADSDAPIENYRRELDLSTATARVQYQQGGVRYWREYFASYRDGVIVVRLGADRPNRLSFTARLAVPDARKAATSRADGRITVAGTVADNGLAFEAQLEVLNSGGSREQGTDTGITVRGANEALLLLSAGTNYAPRFPTYRDAHPHERIRNRIDAAKTLSGATLWSRHVEDYRALFGRMSLDIGQHTPDLPTDRVLAQYGKGPSEVDRWLEAVYFQYGRYLLISSSRAGSLPANLQGVWNQSDRPPWNADYHVNINLQMNYWLAEPTNLAETSGPLFDFVESLVEPGRLAAKQVFGADGWTVFLNANVYGHTGLIAWPTAFWQPEAGAWLAQHFYEHYLFSGDERFLRERAWPVMRDAAKLWLDCLRPDPHTGQLTVSPSYSPEHGPFTAGAAMSQQIVFDLFTNTAAAAHVLGESAFEARVKAALAKLDPGTRIGSWGQLQEWRADKDDRKDDHRHASHLFAVYPGSQISPRTTPELANAARVSLNARGDGGTGWSKAWKINLWARLLDGDRAHKLLGEQLRFSTLQNLFDTHPPFQIDGNFGAASGVAEMLLQSHNGEVHILPALPKAWTSGSVHGLRARGNLVVDVTWRGGEATEVLIKSASDGTVRLRSTLLDSPHRLIDRSSGKTVACTGSGQVCTFTARARSEYLLQKVAAGEQ